MSAYIIFDVEVLDLPLYQEYMRQVKPMLDALGAEYLVRGGAFKVYEGDWAPRRIVLLKFPSIAVWDEFYSCPEYLSLKSIRDASSSGRLVGVEGTDDIPR